MNNILAYVNRKWRHLLGIEIGKSFVSMVELSYDGFRYQVETCQHLTFDRPLVSDAAMFRVVNTVIRKAKPKTKTKSVAIALAYSEVLLKEIQVPAGLSSKDTREYLRFNLSSEGEDVGDFVVDYQIINKPEKNGDYLNLQLVAAKKYLVTKWCELFGQAGLDVCVIDVDIYALERVSRYQLGDISEIVMVININYESAMVMVLDGKNILYFQVDDIDKKCLRTSDAIVRYIKSRLELIYAALTLHVNRLVVGGDRFMHVGLVDILRDVFAMSVVVADPFINMELAKQIDPVFIRQISSAMLISCGLALRA